MESKTPSNTMEQTPTMQNIILTNIGQISEDGGVRIIDISTLPADARRQILKILKDVDENAEKRHKKRDLISALSPELKKMVIQSLPVRDVVSYRLLSRAWLGVCTEDM